MSTLSLRLPDSLHTNLKRAADRDGVSINQFVSLAVAEKLSALQTFDIIAERAKGASRDKFLNAMALVPDREVVEGDEPALQVVHDRLTRLDRMAKISLEHTSDRGFKDAVPADVVEGARDVVRTEACNSCHNPLQLHGGFRREGG